MAHDRKNYRVRADHYDQVKQQRKDYRTIVHEPPTGEDAELREAMRTDLELFLRTCFPQAYSLEFSDDHYTVIDALYRTVTRGQKKAIAMPRGSGKTTLCSHTALFALLYGYRKYLFIVAADQSAAKNLIDGLKAELSFNENVARYFPEVATYFAATEGNALRAKNQLNEDGEPTGLQIGAEKLVFPNAPGSESCEAVVESAGITGRIRGARHATMQSGIIRPDCVLVDDPSTSESAESESQNDKRLQIIRSDIMGLSGPGTSIAAMIACTVIAEDDLASQLLDRKESPEWRGEKIALVHKWPEAEKMWEEYVEMYRTESEEDRGHDESLAFYKKNRKKMDKGGKVSWEERYIRGEEISAIQHAYNLRAELGDDAFQSEYMNSPNTQNSSEYKISPNLVASRVNLLPKMVAHPESQALTAHIDLNYSALHYAVMAHTRTGIGYVVDYGAFTNGGKALITKEEAEHMTETEIDQRFYQGLDVLVNQVLLGNEYMRDGTRMPLDLIGVDASYKMFTVCNFCDNMRLRGKPVMPCVGRGAKNYRPVHVIGSMGDGYNVQKQAGKIKTNSLFYNADLWRERSQRAWLQAPGSPGSISVYGEKPKEHKYFARQVAAEELVEKVHGETETLYVWKIKPGQHNDLGDNVTVNYVLGAAVGCGPYRVGAGRPVRKKRKKRGSVKSTTL